MTIKEITPLQAGDGIQTCPDCGYDRGFNVSFVNTAGARNNPVKSTREVFRAILICPECGARFDVGWRVSFSQITLTAAAAVSPVPGCIPHGNPRNCLPLRITNGKNPPG